MALSKNVKIALWGCGSLLFVTIALVVVFVVVVLANKDTLVQGAQHSTESGTAFGRAHSQTECVSEGLRQNAACSGLVCETGVNLFLDSCLRAAPEDPSLCAGVPEPSEILKSAAWCKQRCSEIGRPGNQPCLRLMQAQLQHCNTTSHGTR